MPILPQLLNDIQVALGASIVPSLNAGSREDDIYEAYLFTLVLRAARSEGGTIAFRCINGGTPNPFVFRTSPGYIASSTQNYGYAEIGFPGCFPLEAHVGIRVSGKSNVLHECDVAVLLKSEADLCRAGPDRVAPRSAKVILAIEAKYYSASVPLGLGREFLGLTRDLSTRNAFFVVNRDAGSLKKLLTHKREMWEHNITPAQSSMLDRFAGVLRTAFKDFKAGMP